MGVYQTVRVSRVAAVPYRLIPPGGTTEIVEPCPNTSFHRVRNVRGLGPVEFQLWNLNSLTHLALVDYAFADQ